MKLKTALSSASLALLALAGAPAHAVLTVSTPDCAAGNTDTNPGYVTCLGSFDLSTGNVDNDLGSVMATLGLPSGTDYFNSDNAATAGNPFASVVGGATSGTITFDNAQTGTFWLALKSATQASFYKFDGSTVAGGITSLGFDTLGTSLNKRGIAQNLSHAGYIGTPTPAVPEPETYAMMLAGLAGIGFLSRRRRAG
jgi:PEP-CTERM motif